MSTSRKETFENLLASQEGFELLRDPFIPDHFSVFRGAGKIWIMNYQSNEMTAFDEWTADLSYPPPRLEW